MERAPCRVCHRESARLNERDLCPGCNELVEIARRNLEGAKKSTLPSPKVSPPCDDCGGPQKPVLFRPEGPWTFYCVTGCRYCRECHKIHKGREICPIMGDERARASGRKRRRNFVN
jgi:hypothetical protein